MVVVDSGSGGGGGSNNNQELFIEAEGVELMLLIMKGKGYMYKCALKTLTAALRHSPPACAAFVECLGLKTLFAGMYCLPSTVYPQLSAVNCSPSTVCPQLSAVNCLPSTVRPYLFALNCLPSTVRP